MPRGKAIALLFSQNSENFKGFLNFTPNSKSAKRQSYRLTIFSKFTIFAKFRKFQGIFQSYTEFKVPKSERHFMPKGKVIALPFCNIQKVSGDIQISHKIKKMAVNLTDFLLGSKAIK